MVKIFYQQKSASNPWQVLTIHQKGTTGYLIGQD